MIKNQSKALAFLNKALDFEFSFWLTLKVWYFLGKSEEVLMFQFILAILFLSFSSCTVLNKSLKSNRKTANKDIEKAFEFESVDTLWFKDVSPKVYEDMTKFVEEEKKAIKGYAEDFIKEFSESSFFPFRLEVTNMREFNKDDPRVISVGLELYRFTGGAHGNTNYITWNWDNKEKKYLSLRDYVKKDQEKKFKSDLKEATLQAVDQEYRNVDWIERSISSIDIEDFQAWNIDGDNIVMTFIPYQVAVYAAGLIEVSVPKP